MIKYKVIFHLDENEKLPLVMSNALNLKKNIEGEEVNIEIVVNALAVKSFISEDNKYYERLKDLKSKNIRILLCKNSLKTYGIKEEELLEEIEVISSAVEYMVRKQYEGYAYLKP
ncbi:DsrE family protein [Clostridium amazonitimonense]|uniref:DsrE family protein n=1 Tax=Clostridium amazonitimonense TaxID=1499689 RepID=UPI00050957ED|nr:DsrE family protein [Clostridium amazonitimonense]